MTFNMGSQQENTENPSVNMEQWFWLVCCVVVVVSGSTASMTELS